MLLYLSLPNLHDIESYSTMFTPTDKNHFRVDLCYNPNDDLWYHFDPYNFPEARVLRLEPNLPVVMGGNPIFPDSQRERRRAREWFKGTVSAEIANVVYVLQSEAPSTPPPPVLTYPSSTTSLTTSTNTTVSNSGSSSISSSPSSAATSNSGSTSEHGLQYEQTCSECEFVVPHEDADFVDCEHCATVFHLRCYAERGGQCDCRAEQHSPPAEASPLASPSPSLPTETWTCPCCTWPENPVLEPVCEICTTEQPKDKAPVKESWWIGRFEPASSASSEPHSTPVLPASASSYESHSTTVVIQRQHRNAALGQPAYTIPGRRELIDQMNVDAVADAHERERMHTLRRQSN
jgi:hypothetical protein